MRKNYFLVAFLVTLIFTNSCEKKSSKQGQRAYNSAETTSNRLESSSDVHVDDQYKYEYRTGTTGNYEYNYDVSGDGVEGNVDMQGKYGSGTVTDNEGNEKEVEVEWVDYGVMEATDEDGNTYTLEAD